MYIPWKLDFGGAMPRRRKQAMNNAEALFEACSLGKPRVAARMAALVDPSCVDIHGFPPLTLAAFHGHTKVVRAILPHCDPMAVDDCGCNALMWAASNGQLECVELLVQHCDPGAADTDGVTALMKAAGMGRENCSRVLARLCDQDARDARGLNALMWAAMRGSVECVEALAGGAPQDAVSLKGNTALMCAAMGLMGRMGGAGGARELACVDVLIRRGHRDVPNHEGITAAAVARSLGQPKLAERIEAAEIAMREREIFDAMIRRAPSRPMVRAGL
jgi:ankyrin repeat protein